MIEAQCQKCGESFNPSDPDDLTHETSWVTGTECGGRGIIVGESVR